MWRAEAPIRPNPRIPRRQSRPSWRSDSGASVATRHNDETILLGLRRTFVVEQFLGQRNAVKVQVAPNAVVALDNYANGEFGIVDRNNARTASDAALESIQDHAGAATDVSFGDRATGRRVEDREHVLLF